MKAPTTNTYTILETTALARIEKEWSLSDSQRVVMRAMVLLSYSEGQSWALIPCQQKLATALRVHKATVSRAIRSCITLGILERLERQHETLYRVMPNAQGVPAVADDASETAMRELVELQRTRLQGTAEGNGQLRLPGVLPSEEIDAPAEAFAAQMTNDGDVQVGEDEAYHRHLESLVRNGPPEAAAQTRAPEPMPEPRSPALRWTSALNGLNAGQSRIMELLRQEARATNAESERAVIEYAFRWRKEVKNRPLRLLEEIIAEHKYFRLSGKPWDSVGKFVDAQLRKIDARAEAAAGLDSS